MTGTDARLRTLKRAAQAGDVEARQRLWEEAYRFGAFKPTKIEQASHAAFQVDPDQSRAFNRGVYIGRLRLASFLGDRAADEALKPLFGPEKIRMTSSLCSQAGVRGSSRLAIGLVEFCVETWDSQVGADPEPVRDSEVAMHTFAVRAAISTRVDELLAAFPAEVTDPGPLLVSSMEIPSWDLPEDVDLGRWAQRLLLAAELMEDALHRYGAGSLRFDSKVPPDLYRHVVECEAERLAARQGSPWRERITERTPKTQAEKALKAFLLPRLLPVLSEGWIP